jgi:acyl-coenzyme A thioesterase PaaI-like protein
LGRLFFLKKQDLSPAGDRSFSFIAVHGSRRSRAKRRRLMKRNIRMHGMAAILLAAGLVLAGCPNLTNNNNDDTYTVTYSRGEGGGTAPAPSQNIAVGTSIFLPNQGGMTAPSGHIFGGWTSGGQNYRAGDGYTVMGDITFTARWVSSTANYTVTYAIGNGDGVAPGSQSYSFQTSITLPNDNGMTAPSGNTFGGWTTGGQTYAAGDSYTVMDDTTFTARWVSSSATYTITYNRGSGGGTAPSSLQNITVGTSITLSAQGAMTAPSGNTFGGWTAGGKTYAAGDSYTVMDNTTFTALWISSSATYTVTYNRGDGSGTAPAPSQNIAAGASVTLPNQSDMTAPNGTSFGGWTAAGKTYAAGDSYAVLGDITFTARWVSSTATYTVTYDRGSGGGTAPASQNSTVGTSIFLPNQGDMTAPSGTSFGGWIASGRTYAAGARYTVLGDTTFTALWSNLDYLPEDPGDPSGDPTEPGDTYQVSYSLGEGSGAEPVSSTYAAGETITLPTWIGTAPTGKTFAGWTAGGRDYAAGDNYTVTGDVTFTARFESSQSSPISVTINQGDAAKIAIGERMDLSATVTPSGTNTLVTWSSSDENVAIVSRLSGQVSGKTAGTAVITALAVTTGSPYTQTDTITITVTDGNNEGGNGNGGDDPGGGGGDEGGGIINPADPFEGTWEGKEPESGALIQIVAKDGGATEYYVQNNFRTEFVHGIYTVSGSSVDFSISEVNRGVFDGGDTVWVSFDQLDATQKEYLGGSRFQQITVTGSIFTTTNGITFTNTGGGGYGGGDDSGNGGSNDGGYGGGNDNPGGGIPTDPSTPGDDSGYGGYGDGSDAGGVIPEAPPTIG